MLEHAAAASEEAAAGLELLPGVELLLKTLAARDDTVVALVTGNLEPIAWTKMRRLGIYQHFTAPGEVVVMRAEIGRHTSSLKGAWFQTVYKEKRSELLS